MQPACHEEVQFGGRIAQRLQAVGGEVDAVLDKPPVDLPGEVVVGIRAQPPDPCRVSRDERLGEHDQPRTRLRRRMEMDNRGVERRFAVKQHRRLLNDCHPDGATLTLHKPGL